MSFLNAQEREMPEAAVKKVNEEERLSMAKVNAMITAAFELPEDEPEDELSEYRRTELEALRGY